MCNSRIQSSCRGNQFQPAVTTSETEFICATVFDKSSTGQVNTRDLNSSSAASLKTSDPFMYYSVPTLRQAALLNKDVGSMTFQVPTSPAGPSDMDIDGDEADDSCMVKRQTRITTECHADLIFEELMGLNENQDETDCEEDSDDEDEDLLMAVLATNSSISLTS